MQISEALLKLDPEDDRHWTAEGLPLIRAVADLVGEDVTRKQITEARPGFSRDSAGDDPEHAGPDLPPAPLLELPQDEFIAWLGRSYDFVCAVRNENDAALRELHREKDRILAQISKHDKISVIVERQATRLRPKDQDSAGFREFRKKQHALRAKRVEQAREFVRNTKVPVADLQKELETKSPIDKALGAKRPRKS